MKRVIVAFTGKRGHGKTTAAEALLQNGYAHINFADPLRQVVGIAYGLSLEEMLDPVLKEQRLDRWPFKSPRQILQFVGTDMFRAYEDETWTRCFERAIGGFSHVACSDLRFPNEATCLRLLREDMRDDNVVLVIRVTDPRKNSTDAAAQHASETEIDKIVADVEIVNDGSVADLQRAVLKAVAFAERV